MFNFQKEVVINDANLLSIDTNHIKIDREGDYKKDCVVDTTVYHTMGVKPFVDRMFMRVGEFDPAIVGKHVQFVFELSTKTDYQGEFATATWKFKKPVIVDIELPEDVSEAVVALINACNTVGSKYWRAYTTVPTNPTALFIEMSDANLKIVNFKIYSFDCAESCVDPHEEVNLIYE